MAPQQGQLRRDVGSSRAQKDQEREQEEGTSLELTPGRGKRAEGISLVPGKGLGCKSNLVQPISACFCKGGGAVPLP